MKVNTTTWVQLASDFGPTPVTVANRVADGGHRMWLILGDTPNTISIFPGRRHASTAPGQLDNLEQLGNEIVAACKAERERQGWTE